MKLTFSKMHGLGNDFVVLDGITQPLSLDSDQIQFVADRHFGIGCDQILLVEAAQTPGVDFRYRIFNADGDEVEQCGNGARCFAKFVRAQGLTDKTSIVVETNTGIITLLVQDNGQVRVDMGAPQLEPDQIPFCAKQYAVCYNINVAGQNLELGAVSMGNPHAVITVADVDQAPVQQLGPVVEKHERFPERVNVGFMQLLSRQRIRLRVYERGVGETLACGSGACAAVVAGVLQQLLDSAVTVELAGGELQLQWSGPGHNVIMTGPATQVFKGEMIL